jgi:hypothetical protein
MNDFDSPAEAFSLLQASPVNGPTAVTASVSSIGEYVVIVGKPQHYCSGVDILHHLGESAHLRGTISPVLRVVDVRRRHQGPPKLHYRSD